MANYAYIDVRIRFRGPTDTSQPQWRPLSKQEKISAFTPILTSAVLLALGPRWRVSLTDFEDDGPTWVVTVPGTARRGLHASKRMLAPGEDVGFPVALQKGQIAFRHGPNMFARWAQGCVEEELADHFQSGVYFDATDETMPPGTVEYRRGKTFREYLARNFEKPLSPEDETWIESFRELTPDGFW